MKEITKKVCSVAMASSFLAACGASDEPKEPLRRMEAATPDWAKSVSIKNNAKFQSDFTFAGQPQSVTLSGGAQNIGSDLQATHQPNRLYIQDKSNVICRWEFGKFSDCSVENPDYTKFMEGKQRPYLVNWGQPLAPKP